jgi:hypothetical protein
MELRTLQGDPVRKISTIDGTPSTAVIVASLPAQPDQPPLLNLEPI